MRWCSTQRLCERGSGNHIAGSTDAGSPNAAATEWNQMAMRCGGWSGSGSTLQRRSLRSPCSTRRVIMVLPLSADSSAPYRSSPSASGSTIRVQPSREGAEIRSHPRQRSFIPHRRWTGWSDSGASIPPAIMVALTNTSTARALHIGNAAARASTSSAHYGPRSRSNRRLRLAQAQADPIVIVVQSELSISHSRQGTSSQPGNTH